MSFFKKRERKPKKPKGCLFKLGMWLLILAISVVLCFTASYIITYRSIFKPILISYYISDDFDNSVVEYLSLEERVKVGDSLYSYLYIPQKQGARFMGLYTAPHGGEQYVTADFKWAKVPDESILLYPVFKE